MAPTMSPESALDLLRQILTEQQEQILRLLEQILSQQTQNGNPLPDSTATTLSLPSTYCSDVMAQDKHAAALSREQDHQADPLLKNQGSHFADTNGDGRTEMAVAPMPQEPEGSTNGFASNVEAVAPHAKKKHQRSASFSDQIAVIKSDQDDIPMPRLGRQGSKIGSSSSIKSALKQPAFEHHQIDSRQAPRQTISSSSTKQLQEMQKSYVGRLVSSYYFEAGFAFAIISNSFFVGFQVEYAASERTNETPASFYAVQYFYAGAFLTELILRIIAHGRSFFYFEGQWHWNYLDIFIVGSSLFEAVMDTIVHIEGTEGGASVSGTSNARIVRILRIARLMRIIRIARILKFIHALRTFIYSIIATLRSLLWALVLLFMILYVFGILFTQTAGDFLIDNPASPFQASVTDPKTDPELETWRNRHTIERYWGTLPRSMFSLYKSISGGISWDEVVHPLSEFGGIWVCAFVVYISFTYFAVLNVVTGIFCQSAIETAQENEDLMVHAQIASKELYISRIKRLFKELDEDGSGNVTMEELEAHIDDDTVQACFASMQIDTSDACTLFKLLDSDGGTDVDVQEFVNGLMRLKGNAKRADFVELHVVMKKLNDNLLNLEKRVDQLSLLNSLPPARNVIQAVGQKDKEGVLPRENDTQSTTADDQRSDQGTRPDLTDFFQAPWDNHVNGAGFAGVSQSKPWDLLAEVDDDEPRFFEIDDIVLQSPRHPNFSEA